MLTETEAQTLMQKLYDLRKKAITNPNKTILNKLKSHEELCMAKFRYLVTMRTSRYKKFSNYDDLNQEGFEALLKSMKNYNAKKGSFFFWAHRYIDTRIARSANRHTTIRYPLKYAKAITPHKESTIPVMVETRYCPDLILETSQTQEAVRDVVQKLESEQRSIVTLAFGLNGDKPLSITKICKKLQISRPNCVKALDSAVDMIRHQIRI